MAKDPTEGMSGTQKIFVEKLKKGGWIATHGRLFRIYNPPTEPTGSDGSIGYVQISRQTFDAINNADILKQAEHPPQLTEKHPDYFNRCWVYARPGENDREFEALKKNAIERLDGGDTLLLKSLNEGYFWVNAGVKIDSKLFERLKVEKHIKRDENSRNWIRTTPAEEAERERLEQEERDKNKASHLKRWRGKICAAIDVYSDRIDNKRLDAAIIEIVEEAMGMSSLEDPPRRICEHPWHTNPALLTPCPECGAGKDDS